MRPRPALHSQGPREQRAEIVPHVCRHCHIARIPPHRAVRSPACGIPLDESRSAAPSRPTASPGRSSPAPGRSASTARLRDRAAGFRASSSSGRSSTSGRARVWFELRDGEGAVPCSIWRQDFDAPPGALRDGSRSWSPAGATTTPAARQASPAFSFRGHPRAARRRGRPAGAADGAAARARGRGPVRAAERKPPAAAAACDRRRHGRERQGRAPRPPRRPRAPRLGRHRHLGLRAGSGPPGGAADHARDPGPRGAHEVEVVSSPAAAAASPTSGPSATRRSAARSRCCACP